MKLYVDMDGCLAKWDTQASVEDTYETGYFLHREPQENLVEAVRIISTVLPVCILSAVYTTGTAMADKERWLKEVGLGAVPRRFVPYGSPKHLYTDASGGPEVLIDDYSRNLHNWEQSGRTGIKFLNGINGTHGTWHGYTLDHQMDVPHLVRVITGIFLTADMPVAKSLR